MDYDRAIADLEKVAGDGAPKSQDPFALNNLADCYLVRELYRMGALDPADYLDDRFIGPPKRPATAAARKRIPEILERATAIEEDRLRAQPDDVDMLYARGGTRALQSSYSGLVERSWFTALRAAMAARRDHQRVLQLSPAFTDANLIVGAHDYVMASLPWAVKTAAAVIGFHGNRERGIEELRAAVDGAGQASIDAKILLALFLRREGHTDDALGLVHDLLHQFPGNVIFAVQEGDLLRAAHREEEALAAYKRVWTAGRAGAFPAAGYEIAAIRMGDLQRFRQENAEALSSYGLLEDARQAPPELRQRALASAGQIYDSQGKSDSAVEKYRAVVAIGGSNEWTELARRRLRSST
jgi:tetratricopeptide (TPR) repeat protein